MAYRVVQWTTGAVGREALRGILDHPELELVGVKAYSADKDGMDAGSLVERAPIGVTATVDTEELLARTPDAVLYTPASGRTHRRGGRDTVDRGGEAARALAHAATRLDGDHRG